MSLAASETPQTPRPTHSDTPAPPPPGGFLTTRLSATSTAPLRAPAELRLVVRELTRLRRRDVNIIHLLPQRLGHFRRQSIEELVSRPLLHLRRAGAEGRPVVINHRVVVVGHDDG